MKKYYFLLSAFLVLLPTVAGAVSAGPSAAENDLLKRVAMMSDRALRGMLLDVARAGDRLVAVGEMGHVLCSDDGGENWTQASVPVSVTLTAVFFATPQLGWAVGHDTVVLHSGDGGMNWRIQFNGFEAAEINRGHAENLVAEKKKALDAAPEEKRAAVTRELDDLSDALADCRAAVTDGLCCEPLMDVWFKNEREGMVVGAFGQIYHTLDGGQTWTPVWERLDNPGRLHLNGIAGADGALFICGESGTIHRSLDKGKNWHPLDVPYHGSFFNMIACETSAYVMAVGLGGNLVYSKDLGETWTHVKTDAGASFGGGTHLQDGSILAVSYSGVLVTCAATEDTYRSRKVGGGWISAAKSPDGGVVIVGVSGVKKLSSNDVDPGDK